MAVLKTTKSRLLSFHGVLTRARQWVIAYRTSPKAKAFLTSLPVRPKVAWPKLFPKADEKGLDLLDKLLSFDPFRRIDLENALAHSYLSPYYDPADEPVSEKPFTFDMEFDELPTKELKEMVFKEVVDFKMTKLKETSL